MTSQELKQAASEMGLNQSQLAASMGISRAAICRWESGSRPIPKWAGILIGLLKAVPSK